MKSYVSAIKAVLKEDNVKFQEDTYLLNSLTRACRLQNDQIKTRLPIKKGLLSIILNRLTDIFSTQPYLCLLYRALFSTMYYRLLRISEVSQGLHAVKANDVQIGYNKRKFLLVLRTSKTHWKNMKPQLIKISASTCMKPNKIDRGSCTLPCPYHLLREYAQARGGYISTDEPFFVFTDKSPIPQRQIAVWFKNNNKSSWI